MHVLDGVLGALEAEIAAHPPERGGALLGPRGRPLVTELVPDPEAVSRAATWTPSRALDARVKDREREGHVELKGLVHSHPPGLDAPSAQDARELAEGLARNGHMASYLAPVVTRGPVEDPLLAHELPLVAGKVSFYAAWRARGGGAEVRPEPVRVVPLCGDLARAAAAMGGGASEVRVAEVEGGPVLAGRIALAGLELLVLTGEHHPALPPAVLATPDGGPTAQLEVSWDLSLPGPDRLVAALRGALPERFPEA
ncbi:MAG TPA: Mov34/MPN/PAD-1 family protein, partial [Anaeromyxobacteraceae bacterium]|nr:Mov34/MPN/PAD-1 family protein [Anaeromyxobacteraceae bacterium]